MYCLCIFDIIGATGNFVKCAGKKRVFLIGTVDVSRNRDVDICSVVLGA